MQTLTTSTLPAGYELEQDSDGDWVLIPPADITIFSVPGEGWLVTDDFMVSRDWNSRADVEAACLDFLVVAA